PTSTLFPYTTLFRSERVPQGEKAAAVERAYPSPVESEYAVYSIKYHELRKDGDESVRAARCRRRRRLRERSPPMAPRSGDSLCRRRIALVDKGARHLPGRAAEMLPAGEREREFERVDHSVKPSEISVSCASTAPPGER